MTRKNGSGKHVAYVVNSSQGNIFSSAKMDIFRFFQPQCITVKFGQYGARQIFNIIIISAIIANLPRGFFPERTGNGTVCIKKDKIVGFLIANMVAFAST